MKTRIKVEKRCNDATFYIPQWCSCGFIWLNFETCGGHHVFSNLEDAQNFLNAELERVKAVKIQNITYISHS